MRQPNRTNLQNVERDNTIKSVLDRCPPLPDDPVLDHRYQRPCVRACWHTHKPRWVPVIGTIHSDPEHVKADFLHVHVDYRFLTNATKRGLIRSTEESNQIFNANPVHFQPVSYVWPQGMVQEIKLDSEHLPNVSTEDWLTIRRRQYTGPYPEYPHMMVPWHQALSEAYAGSRLIDGKCSHQGTDLSGFTPDRQGIITCPLHGLQWCASTGMIVVP